MLGRVTEPFPDSYSSEESCEAFLFKWRWSDGFCCPCCENESYYYISTRKLYECRSCRLQVSVTAGTIMHNSKIPLWIWFRAIELLTREDMKVSSISLAAMLGVNYRTARLMQSKIQFAFQKMYLREFKTFDSVAAYNNALVHTTPNTDVVEAKNITIIHADHNSVTSAANNNVANGAELIGDIKEEIVVDDTVDRAVDNNVDSTVDNAVDTICDENLYGKSMADPLSGRVAKGNLRDNSTTSPDLAVRSQSSASVRIIPRSRRKSMVIVGRLDERTFFNYKYSQERLISKWMDAFTSVLLFPR
ncbi:Transposase zinc-ribbon domain protein [compost metagenome]